MICQSERGQGTIVRIRREKASEDEWTFVHLRPRIFLRTHFPAPP